MSRARRKGIKNEQMLVNAIKELPAKVKALETK